jgi:hypothetical protein
MVFKTFNKTLSLNLSIISRFVLRDGWIDLYYIGRGYPEKIWPESYGDEIYDELRSWIERAGQSTGVDLITRFGGGVLDE